MTATITDIDQIPVELMQAALEESKLSYTVASVEIGWGKDSMRLKRAIGLKEERAGGYAKFIDYDTAVKMVRAWNVDPVDYGV